MKSGKENHPSLKLAKGFVEMALRSRQFADGERLPPLRQLARKARVSPAAISVECPGILIERGSTPPPER